MSPFDSDDVSRRQFVRQTALGSAAALAAPAVATAAKAAPKSVVVGSGDYQYEAIHDWARLPDKYVWQTTHNAAVGSDGLVYVIHQGLLDKPDHPSIFAFDGDGQFVRAFGEQFQGGGHGIEIRTEGGEDFLYVCNYQQQRSFAKLTAKGEILWRRGAPVEAGCYHEGEEKFPREKEDNPWGRDRFLPTNIAFDPNGGFFLTDGYGAYRVHYFDNQDRWCSLFGRPNTEEKKLGSFNLPHGIGIDTRGDAPWRVAIADRVNARLQWFTPRGEHLETLDGFLLPANIDVQGDLMVVPDLFGRVTLLGPNNQILAHLGDDSQRMQADKEFTIRRDESKWLPGKFVHPHDACFDADGNIYVVEWVERGRITKLRRLS